MTPARDLENLSELQCKFPPVVAELPPELFYSYNPSGPATPSYRVLPLPTKLTWEEQMRCRLSISRNPKMNEELTAMRKANRVDEIVTFPSMNNFHFDKYLVRYVPTDPKPEWRLYRPDTAPTPYEGNTRLPAVV